MARQMHYTRWVPFMRVFDRLCPTGDDEAPVSAFVEALGWPLEHVLAVAEWCDDRRWIETARGDDGRIEMIEGVYIRGR